MTYAVGVRSGGTKLSLVIALVSCLLPLRLAVGEGLANGLEKGSDVKRQLEQQLTQVLSRDIASWQRGIGLTSLQHTIDIRVPSGAVNLALCPEVLQIDSGSTGLVFGNLQRQVHCISQGWSMFVRARVKLTAKLPVANRAMKRGEIVRRQDIVWRTVKLRPSDDELIARIDEIVGRQVVRKLGRNRVIQLHHLSAPLWVNIGDKVIIEARSGGFYANMRGEALESGSDGQQIRVRNLSSGKIITAYPIARGRVSTRF